ncbi:hypothetical protein P7K49_026911 [Saguinus oedipus]|uniref:Uncharacterized protein n=1 Tax=Saguinus oedipus TaxID=9490 RepID=A0ABQ9UEP9_SAGOE|nr:hypothetical protein P7K49_026911 [Saguinus oedipus]
MVSPKLNSLIMKPYSQAAALDFCASAHFLPVVFVQCHDPIELPLQALVHAHPLNCCKLSGCLRKTVARDVDSEDHGRGGSEGWSLQYAPEQSDTQRAELTSDKDMYLDNSSIEDASGVYPIDDDDYASASGSELRGLA